MANILKKITTRAKQLYKAHPSSTWHASLKKAAAELRKGKKVGARPESRPKRRVMGVRKPATRRRRIGNTSQPGVGIQAVSGIYGATETQLRGAMLLKLEQQLGQHYIKRDRAKLKRDKKSWGKLINETKAKIRKLKP